MAFYSQNNGYGFYSRRSQDHGQNWDYGYDSRDLAPQYYQANPNGQSQQSFNSDQASRSHGRLDLNNDQFWGHHQAYSCNNYYEADYYGQNYFSSSTQNQVQGGGHVEAKPNGQGWMSGQAGSSQYFMVESSSENLKIDLLYEIRKNGEEIRKLGEKIRENIKESEKARESWQKELQCWREKNS